MINKEPWSIQIEPTYGCNKKCDFCAITMMGDKKVNFMSLELADKISKDLGNWLDHKRIEFAVRGEPLLNPNIFEIINKFRINFKKSQLTMYTNSIKLYKNKNLKIDVIEDLYKSGLNYILVENYNGIEEMKKFQDDFSDAGYEIYYYHLDKKDKHFWNFLTYHGYNDKKIIILNSVSDNKTTKKQRELINCGGNVDFSLKHKYGYRELEKPLEKKCVKPFRELSIFSDGTIPICCMDWKKECIIGKFPEDGTLKEIWNSQFFDISRRLILDRKRYFNPCKKCDYFGGYRQGFLDVEEDKKFSVDNYEKIFEDNYLKYNRYHDKDAKYSFYKSRDNKLIDFL